MQYPLLIQTVRFIHPDADAIQLQEMDIGHWKSGTTGLTLRGFVGQIT